MNELVELQKNVRKLIRVTIGLYLVTAVVMVALAAGFVHQRSSDRRFSDENRATNALICHEVEALKAIQSSAISDQIDTSKTFLRDHPAGVQGITPALVRDGIARNEKTLHQLRPRPCRR